MEAAQEVPLTALGLPAILLVAAVENARNTPHSATRSLLEVVIALSILRSATATAFGQTFAAAQLLVSLGKLLALALRGGAA
ncbi:hypothetical protein [Caldinitratiruptor microaerophilus]|uniref:Uncharacterized protein n=1 Tax=Caldinitratiruptor microaerophilus TaxID=671077 RepID=A0AA35CP27_9FIRM|nr:hypothetical protein [Caldinitratiruptor microaerophilus]BDG62169.1 hypothetical protein caldi_32590 [Caldinitratiruptor microaerophilus]